MIARPSLGSRGSRRRDRREDIDPPAASASFGYLRPERLVVGQLFAPPARRTENFRRFLCDARVMPFGKLAVWANVVRRKGPQRSFVCGVFLRLHALSCRVFLHLMLREERALMDTLRRVLFKFRFPLVLRSTKRVPCSA